MQLRFAQQLAGLASVRLEFTGERGTLAYIVLGSKLLLFFLFLLKFFFVGRGKNKRVVSRNAVRFNELLIFFPSLERWLQRRREAPPTRYGGATKTRKSSREILFTLFNRRRLPAVSYICLVNWMGDLGSFVLERMEEDLIMGHWYFKCLFGDDSWIVRSVWDLRGCMSDDLLPFWRK